MGRSVVIWHGHPEEGGTAELFAAAWPQATELRWAGPVYPVGRTNGPILLLYIALVIKLQSQPCPQPLFSQLIGTVVTRA
jgi:hypothetical protein